MGEPARALLADGTSCAGGGAVAAAKASRAAGHLVIGVTVEADSALAKNCDRTVIAGTHPREGIVMTTSASLMLLLGLQLIGRAVPASLVDVAEGLLEEIDGKL